MTIAIPIRSYSRHLADTLPLKLGSVMASRFPSAWLQWFHALGRRQAIEDLYGGGLLFSAQAQAVLMDLAEKDGVDPVDVKAAIAKGRDWINLWIEGQASEDPTAWPYGVPFIAEVAKE